MRNLATRYVTPDELLGMRASTIPTDLSTSIAFTSRFVSRVDVFAPAFAAIGDGGLHPLSERYSTLAAAQAFYPNATALSEQIDRHAIQKAIDTCCARETGALTYGVFVVELRFGRFMIDDDLWINQQSFIIQGLGRGSVFEWCGAAGGVILDIQDSAAVKVRDMVFLGNATNPPLCGIRLNAPTIPWIGTNEYHVIDNVSFGRRFWDDYVYVDPDVIGNHPMSYGIVVGGAAVGNNDQFRFLSCDFHDCTVAGVTILNEQCRWGLIDNPTFDNCGWGIYSLGSVTLVNPQFNRSQSGDMYIENGHMLVYSYWSEQSILLWSQGPFSTLEIFGGDAQLQDPMETQVYYAESFLASGGETSVPGTLLLHGVNILDQNATNAILKVTSGDGPTEPVKVDILGCHLPRGQLDAGYEINAYTAPINVNIVNGNYVRRQTVISTLNAPFTNYHPRETLFDEPLGCLAVTRARGDCTDATTITSGRLYLFGIVLSAGTLVTTLEFTSQAVGATSPTHWWYGLFDRSNAATPFKCLRLTADKTTTAWTAETSYPIPLSSAYTVPVDGMYYLGIMVAAGTTPYLYAKNTTNTALVGRIPYPSLACDTGLTTPPSLPFTATISVVHPARAYAAVY